MSILPSDTPRLPKWPFLVGDAALLGIAVTIALRSPSPYTGSVILAITGCVAFAAILGVLPFLADYAGNQDEALDERQRSLEALTRTVSNSAEQISIAANAFHELSELTKEQLKQAKALPEQSRPDLEQTNRDREEALIAETKALQKELKVLRAAETEKLTDLGVQFQKAIEELKKLPFAPPAPEPEKTEGATTAKLKPVKDLKPEIEDSSVAKPPEPPASPAKKTEAAEPAKKDPEVKVSEASSGVLNPVGTNPDPSEDLSPVEAHSKPDDEEPSPPASSPKTSPEAPSSTHKTKPAAKTESPSSEILDEALAPPASPKNTDESSSLDEFDLEEIAAPKAKHKISPDGVTRLIVTAYIGIGNRLFIRGDGPGLSSDKGVPLQFVSIGKWQWETSDASAPVTFKLYKNDEVECHSLGEVTIDARSQTEVSASF